jgi:hypothetical protein
VTASREFVFYGLLIVNGPKISIQTMNQGSISDILGASSIEYLCTCIARLGMYSNQMFTSLWIISISSLYKSSESSDSTLFLKWCSK